MGSTVTVTVEGQHSTTGKYKVEHQVDMHDDNSAFAVPEFEKRVERAYAVVWGQLNNLFPPASEMIGSTLTGKLELEREIERLKEENAHLEAIVKAGGGSASDWRQKTSTALGIRPGEMCLDLKDVVHCIRHLRERSQVLRGIQDTLGHLPVYGDMSVGGEKL